MIDFLKTLVAFVCLVICFALYFVGGCVAVAVALLDGFGFWLQGAAVYLDRRSRE